MAQTTRSAPRAFTGRITRSGNAQTRAPMRRTPTARTRPGTRTRQAPARFGRKPKQQKGIAGALAGLLPTGAATKATPSSKKGKAGGFAALAAAAGMAFRNRDKLAGMIHRKGGDEQMPPEPTYATPPAPERPGDAPPQASARSGDATPGI